MKKAVAVLCAFVCMIGLSTNAKRYDAVHTQPDIEISAKSAVLIEADTGRVIWQKSADTTLPMASTTKIMTTLLTLESGNLHEEFTVDSDAITVEGSSMGLCYGDVVTKYALCCGMLLPSGNDAANAAAVKLAGDMQTFADMMNAKALEIGMENTHFVTPSGLHDENHYSTAYDMALLARYAMKNGDFRHICSQKSMSVNFGNPPYARTLYNTNKLLERYPYCIGIKTGFTDEAGRCLVSAAEKDGVELICVTLNASDDWNDHVKLYDYGFSCVQLTDIPEKTAFIEVVGAQANYVGLSLAQKLSVGALMGDVSAVSCKIKTAPFAYAPINKGDVLGIAEYYYNDEIIAQIELLATNDVQVCIN